MRKMLRPILTSPTSPTRIVIVLCVQARTERREIKKTGCAAARLAEPEYTQAAPLLLARSTAPRKPARPDFRDGLVLGRIRSHFPVLVEAGRTDDPRSVAVVSSRACRQPPIAI